LNLYSARLQPAVGRSCWKTWSVTAAKKRSGRRLCLGEHRPHRKVFASGLARRERSSQWLRL